MGEISEEYAALPTGQAEILEGEFALPTERPEGHPVPLDTRAEDEELRSSFGHGMGGHPHQHEDDDDLRQMPPGLKREGCKCVTDHRPAVVGTDFHHVVPLGWGGPDVKENIVELCPTTHRSLHDLLRWVVKYQKWPPRNVLYRYPRYVRALGVRAIREAGGIPPRTTVPRTFGGLL